MKKLHFLLLIVITLNACSTRNEAVTIKGTVLGNKNVGLVCSATFNETYNNFFKDTVSIDSTGNFTLSVNIDSPCFFNLLTNSNYKQLIIEPGKTYEVEIDKEIKLINDNEAQVFYDNLTMTHPHSSKFLPLDISDYQGIYDSLDHQLDIEVNNLDKINCTREVYNLIKMDRQVYYNLAIASLASRTNIASYRMNERTPDEVMKMWGNAVSDSFLTNVTTQKASYYYDLVGLAFWYNMYTKLDYDSIKVIRKEKNQLGLIHSYNMELAQQLLPKEIVEFYTATYIHSRAKQKKFEKELISLVEQFKTEYPNSKYTPYMQSDIENIKEFYVKVAASSNEGYQFVENYEAINTIKDCLLPFKGKKIYIDIWSTSCGPCKKQFEFNETLKKTLKEKGVEMIYISLDGDQTEGRWKDMIKYYNLSGNHIRANNLLEADLEQHLGRYGIPRYLIVDELGNIINNDAPRPSNIGDLEKLL